MGYSFYLGTRETQNQTRGVAILLHAKLSLEDRSVYASDKTKGTRGVV
jgi:hypothetical protein